MQISKPFLLAYSDTRSQTRHPYTGDGIAISNIAIVNPKTQQADKVGVRVETDGKKS